MQSIVKAHDDTATSCAWRGDGGIVTCGLDGTVLVWKYDADAEKAHVQKEKEKAKGKDEKKEELPPILSKAKVFSRAHSPGVASVAVNPAGTTLVSSGIDGDVNIYDLETMTRVGTLDLTPSDVWKLAHSPVAPVIASGGHGGVIGIFNLGTGARQAAISTHADFINSVAFSPDGRFVAAACVDGSVHVADVEASAVVASVRGAHLLPVTSVSFSHDGAVLFTGSQDRTIHMYDVSALGGASMGAGAASGGSGSAPGAALIASLSGSLHWVTSVAASPATHHVASASADRAVRIYDVRKRELVHAFEGHSERVWSVSWNPAATRIATVTDAGALGLFPVTSFI